MLPLLLLFNSVRSCVGDIQKWAAESRRVQRHLEESGVSCTEIERHLEVPKSSWSYLNETVAIPWHLTLIYTKSINNSLHILQYFPSHQSFNKNMVKTVAPYPCVLQQNHNRWTCLGEWVAAWCLCLPKGELTDKSKHYSRFCSGQTPAPFLQ